MLNLDNDIFTFRNHIYFRPKKIGNYINRRLVEGSFGTKTDYEILVSLHLRKAYEEEFDRPEDVFIGMELRDNGEDIIERLKDENDFSNVVFAVEKVSAEATYVDIIIAAFNTSGLYKQFKVQIKRFGIGNTKFGGTDKLIELLEKRKLDAALSEHLVIFLHEDRGDIDGDLVEDWIKANYSQIRYRQLLTIHRSKVDDKMHFNRLIYNGEPAKQHMALSKEEMLQTTSTGGASSIVP